MRRFFGGLIAGTVVAAFGLGVVSQINAPRVTQSAEPAPDVSAAPQAEVAGDAAVQPASGEDALAVSAEVAPAKPEVAATAPAATTPMSDIVPATPLDVATAADDAPQEPALVTAAETVPMDDADAAPVPAATVADVAPPPADPPALPLTDPPAAQPAPDLAGTAPTPAVEAGAAIAGQNPAPPVTPLADAAPPAADLPPPPPLTPAEQAMVAEPAPPVAAPAAKAPSAQPATAAVAAEPLPAVKPAPEAPVAAARPAPAPVTEPAAIAPAADVAVAEAPVDPAPSVIALDTPLIEPASRPLAVTPRLIEADEGLIINRLPRIGDDPAPAADTEALPDVVPEDLPALSRYAAAFENPDAKPLFSIVLIDTGGATLDRQAVASLPFPVSVVIDPLAADAAAHAALYRAGGKEVLMLATGIPEGAAPADLEQTFQAHATSLPEAVAVIDTEAGSFQNDRPLATQIVPILAAQGRGLVTWDRGLNAADQVAQREDLPSVVIFRRIDGDGEDTPVIRRYLDRAAFKAAQEGRVTVIGEVRAETVAALMEWAIEGRASTVALAPVSAQMLAP